MKVRVVQMRADFIQLAKRVIVCAGFRAFAFICDTAAL